MERERRRSHSLERRSRHTSSRTRSLDQRLKSRSLKRRSRSRSPDRFWCHNRSPSLKNHRKHWRDDEEKEQQRAAIVEFVNGIARKQQKCSITIVEAPESSVTDSDVNEMMKKFGITFGFDSTKGKPMAGINVSGGRVVMKQQPRMYMNMRGRFNRPLPTEMNW